MLISIMSGQRNESIDLYNTYPLHLRPDNGGRVAQDAFDAGVQRTRQPIVTGTSVLAIKFKDGVILSADNLGLHDIWISNIYTSDVGLNA